MYKVAFAAVALAPLAFHGADAQAAIAIMQKTTSYTYSGQSSGTVLIDAVNTANVSVSFQLTNMEASREHAVHIHDNGDLTALDGQSTGGHLNPNGAGHKCDPTGTDFLTRHVGDMGNLLVASDGTITHSLTNNLPSLDPASQSYVIGRSIVLHENKDDCETQPHGNAGDYVMMGVIGLKNGFSPVVYDNFRESYLEEAVVRVNAIGTQTSMGQVVIQPRKDDLPRMQIQVTGLTPGQQYGLRVHTYGDMSNVASNTMGGLLNPSSLSVATCDSATLAGFLGNYEADTNGEILADASVLGSPSVYYSSSVVGRMLSISSSPSNCDVPAASNIVALGVFGLRPISKFLDVGSDSDDTSGSGVSASPVAAVFVAAVAAFAALLA